MRRWIPWIPPGLSWGGAAALFTLQALLPRTSGSLHDNLLRADVAAIIVTTVGVILCLLVTLLRLGQWLDRRLRNRLDPVHMLQADGKVQQVPLIALAFWAYPKASWRQRARLVWVLLKCWWVLRTKANARVSAWLEYPEDEPDA
jgi:hypothetical protein